jgi:peptide/nickel transport system permease protein
MAGSRRDAVSQADDLPTRITDTDALSLMLNEKRSKQVRAFLRNKTSLLGAGIATVIVLISLFAGILAPYDPVEQNVRVRLKPPQPDHLLGTDSFGRDVLSRILWGSRISLIVGVGSVLFGMVLGTLLGMISGYRGGKTGELIMRLMDILMCFPTEILAIMVLVVLGPGLEKLILTIGAVMTPRFARLAFATTLSVKEREFVLAARAVGVRPYGVLFKHVLPNIFGEILVISSLWTATAIRVEANMSFLGLGVSPPTPTWGNMVLTGVAQLTNAPWLSLFPGLAITLAILSFNLIGDGLRDVMDPKLRG